MSRNTTRSYNRDFRVHQFRSRKQALRPNCPNIYTVSYKPVDDCCHDQESPGVLAVKVCPSTNLFYGQTGLVCSPIVVHWRNYHHQNDKTTCKAKDEKINEEEKNVIGKKYMRGLKLQALIFFLSLHLENSTCSAGPSSSLRCQAHK